MWCDSVLENDVCMSKEVMAGHRLATLWLHKECDDYGPDVLAAGRYKDVFLQRHRLHAVHDCDLTFEDLLLYGYPLLEGLGREDVCSYFFSFSWRVDVTNTIFALGRALSIFHAFSVGSEENLRGCDPLHLCPSHSFFFEQLAFKGVSSSCGKTYVYFPCILPSDGSLGFEGVHKHCWLPFMEMVRDRALLDLQDKSSGSRMCSPFSEYKYFGFDFDPHNSANYMSRYLFICRPCSDTMIVLRLDMNTFNKAFLRKLLSRDCEDVCPITLTPVQELRPICYCRHCYNRFDLSALSKCCVCPLCRKDLR